MQTATSSVEFSFSGTMYRHTDGTMGSLLGSTLANLFFNYQENKLFFNVKKPLFYSRFVNDTFAVFENENDCKKFFSSLNSLHSRYVSRSQKDLTLLSRFLTSYLINAKLDLSNVCQENSSLPANTYIEILLVL